MKKVVNGRVYDTDRCVDVVKWEENDTVQGVAVLVRRKLHRVPTPAAGKSPIDCFETSSYGSCCLKSDNIDMRSGDFFLETTIADICRTYNTCGCRIDPVDEKTARQIVEKYGDYETYCRYFGSPEGVAMDLKEVEKACEPVVSEKWKAETERNELKDKVADLEGEKADLAESNSRLRDAVSAAEAKYEELNVRLRRVTEELEAAKAPVPPTAEIGPTSPTSSGCE